MHIETECILLIIVLLLKLHLILFDIVSSEIHLENNVFFVCVCINLHPQEYRFSFKE